MNDLELIYESMNIKFARFGSMSAKSHDKKKFASDFHRPPVKRGIYAYIYPYIEPFLAAWKYPEGKMPKLKIFNHTGDIWTHFIDAASQTGALQQVKDSWALIHTSDLPKVLSRQKSMDNTFAKQTMSSSTFKDPYRRGQGGWMSKDHLEVFIPGEVHEK